MDTEKLNNFLKQQKQPKFRLLQICQAVFKQTIGDWDEVMVLPNNLRQQLKKEIPLLSFKVKRILLSKNKQAYKALLELKDGCQIETVLLNSKPGLWSCCISSQVGCSLGCLFCATGQMGFKRNLIVEEITDQVLFWKQHLRAQNLPDRLTHVVYMGMGEPLINQSNVFASLKILINSQYFGIGQRNISVSTSGLVGGITQLAKNFPQINLAVSLNAPTDELRRQLMPANQKRPLKFLIKDLQEYFRICRRKVFLEYILFAGINDQKIHGKQLADFINSVGHKNLLQINLIPYNPTNGPYRSPQKEKIQQFRNYLESLGLKVTIRKSLGQDIQAACGQLVTKNT